MIGDVFGWAGLSPDAQFGAVCGASGGLGLWMVGRALLGWGKSRHQVVAERKAKAKLKATRAKTKAAKTRAGGRR